MFLEDNVFPLSSKKVPEGSPFLTPKEDINTSGEDTFRQDFGEDKM